MGGGGLDDAAWPPARVLYKAERWENRRDPASPYGLLARMIPSLAEEEAKPFAAVFESGGGAAPAGWSNLVRNGRPLVLSPGTKVDLILDVGALTTAFPVIAVSGGAGSVVRLTYAEALRLPWETPGATLFGRR